MHITTLHYYIEYDIAGFTGLNSESVDWDMTMGITFIIGKMTKGGQL